MNFYGLLWSCNCFFQIFFIILKNYFSGGKSAIAHPLTFPIPHPPYPIPFLQQRTLSLTQDFLSSRVFCIDLDVVVAEIATPGCARAGARADAEGNQHRVFF